MMTFLASYAAKMVGPRFAKPLVIGVGFLLIAFVAWRMLDSYGDRRFKEASP